MYHLHIHDIHDRFVSKPHWLQTSFLNPSVGRLYVLVVKALSTVNGNCRCTDAIGVLSYHGLVLFVVSHTTLGDHRSQLVSHLIVSFQRPSVVFSLDSLSNFYFLLCRTYLIVLILTGNWICAIVYLSSLYFYHYTLFFSSLSSLLCILLHYMYYLVVLN